MKKILYIYLSVALLSIGCQKTVDINQNPNTPTGTVDEQLYLPTDIVRLAGYMPSWDNYGGGIMGYQVNPGGVSGFGTLVTYNYGPGDFNSLWGMYDIITDLNKIIARSATDPNFLNYAGSAKILKVMIMQMLVDTYNNVPYTDANLGDGHLTPKYDKAEDIYTSIYSLLDEAIKNLQDSKTVALTIAMTAARDPMFQGNVTNWIKLANTLKLKIYLRAKNKLTFPNTTFTSDGFLTADAIVQPGYNTTAGKFNPTWSRTYTDANAAAAGGLQQRVPSFYTLGFYDGTKLTDKYRGYLTYRTFPTPGVNQLGFDPGTATSAIVKAPNDWFLASGTPSATNFYGIGIFKGPDAYMPLFTASESYFLQAEAAMLGLISTTTVKTAFNNGMQASFTYLNNGKNNSVSSLFVNSTTGALSATQGTGYVAINPTNEFNTYLTDNAANYLVNIDLATTNDQKLEAIITQKYIAANMINGGESWNEFRRTGYPITTAPTTANKYTSFVSLQSLAPTANKLPGRAQYPSAEFLYNSVNVALQKGSAANGGINPMADKIFWAQ